MSIPFNFSGHHYANYIILSYRLPTYTCEGGRSFTSSSSGEKPTTWYMAVSNCASLMGLELEYRIEVLGHIGDCPYPVTPSNPASNNNEILPSGGGRGQHNKQSGSGESSLSVSSASDSQVCMLYIVTCQAHPALVKQVQCSVHLFQILVVCY